jgi:SH3-like domain-containing protein
MNRLPQVRWDRCSRNADGQLCVFGWIGREDGRTDFAALCFLWPEDPEAALLLTSSAEHSAAMTAALYGERALAHHTDCERVEDLFGDQVESRIVLAEEEPADGA